MEKVTKDWIDAKFQDIGQHAHLITSFIDMRDHAKTDEDKAGWDKQIEALHTQSEENIQALCDNVSIEEWVDYTLGITGPNSKDLGLLVRGMSAMAQSCSLRMRFYLEEKKKKKGVLVDADKEAWGDWAKFQLAMNMLTRYQKFLDRSIENLNKGRIV